MNRPKLFSEEVAKEFIKMVILIIVFVISKTSTSTSGEEVALIDLIKDSGIIIITSTVYFLIYCIFNIIRKPIKIMVDLKNFVNDKNSTTIYRTGMEREDTCIIVACVRVMENNSAWNKLALWMLKNSKICLCIHSLPRNRSLICQSTSIIEYVEAVEDGLVININDLIFGNLENRVELSRKYNFTVKENRDYPFQSNQEVPIKPYLMIDEKRLNLFNKLLCSFLYSEKEGKHIVEFIK